MKTPTRHSGFTMLELIIVVILVVVLMLVAMDRLLPLRGDAEAAHVATVAGSLRSAIGIEVARLIVRDGAHAVAGLEGSNPMHLLSERPGNYLGEMGGINPAILPKGSWYFDIEGRELVYIVRYDEYFRTDLPGTARIVYKVELVYSEDDRLAGVSLARQNGFIWARSPAAIEWLR